MAQYNQVSYGSQGSDVTELQKLLNQNGYKLAVDGQFGSNTQAAVQDYQQKNNLDVDGIVGQNTWGTLTKTGNAMTGGYLGATPSVLTARNDAYSGSTGGDGSASSASSGSSSKTGTSSKDSGDTTTGDIRFNFDMNGDGGSDFNYGPYRPSEGVLQAQKLLDDQLSNKPGNYQSQWQSLLNDTLQKIMNREPFSYDLNGDALYQQYKNQYVQQGKMAMMDTMGQAQAMTGGYGNSYAQNAGQQAYQAHLQELNNKIPELYRLALDQYQREGDALYDQASLIGQQEDRDYGRYRDQVGDWRSDRDYLADRYESERDFDYGRYADDRNFEYGRYSDDRAYKYQVHRDQVTDEQWQKEFDEAKRQFDKNYSKTSGSGSSGGSRSSGSSGTKKTTTTTKNTETQKEETPKTEEVTWNFKTVTQKCDDYVASGATKSQISTFLTQARQAGYITQAQFTSLKALYVPRGLTY